ncbi:hypothetical protein HanXRQr2_Chr03g0128781 [Helianthus annuus]|uniref:Uncharacterized protein n=1 Tax=Helianthus annuus TaxID=4232 RepID=A0A251V988_HELAN|nr:hypothetical protein HanXRQr2_Chr03g0128781 [Helianthus annuus]
MYCEYFESMEIIVNSKILHGNQSHNQTLVFFYFIANHGWRRRQSQRLPSPSTGEISPTSGVHHHQYQ